MPLENEVKTKAAKGQSVTLTDVEELMIEARRRNAPDDALLKVNVVLEFAAPARVGEAYITW